MVHVEVWLWEGMGKSQAGRKTKPVASDRSWREKAFVKAGTEANGEEGNVCDFNHWHLTESCITRSHRVRG